MQKGTIRPAKKSDCEAMMSLIKELALYEKAPQEVTVSMDEFIDAGFGENPVWQALVLEHDNQVVGMALSYVRYSTWKGRMLYLEDLVVSERYRGMGFGKRLIDGTIELAKDKGYAGVCWQVLDWNQPAIDFYKKYNTKFEEEWLNVQIRF